MKKFILLGVLSVMAVFLMSSLVFGQLGNPNAPLPMAGGPAVGTHGPGHERMEPGRPGQAMMDHSMMAGRGMGHEMMCGMGQGPGMMEMAHHIGKCLAALNLDDRQKKMLDEIKSRIMKETIRKMADIRIAQIELRDLIKQDPLDMKAVEAKIKQIAAMKSDLGISHIRAFEEIKKILTPEQRKKLMDMLWSGPLMDHMRMMQ
jgi:Spy/CpxP family protein refolding chaperone